MTPKKGGHKRATAVLGAAKEGRSQIRDRVPFRIRERHPDNDSPLANDLLRNWTHVRKVVGYRRFDTTSELRLLNETFAELRLNFSVIANLDTLTGGPREAAEQSEDAPPDR